MLLLLIGTEMGPLGGELRGRRRAWPESGWGERRSRMSNIVILSNHPAQADKPTTSPIIYHHRFIKKAKRPTSTVTSKAKLNITEHQLSVK